MPLGPFRPFEAQVFECREASLENLRVLIITGDQDFVVPVERSRFLQKLLQCDLELMKAM